MQDKGLNYRIRATNQTGPAMRGVVTGLRGVKDATKSAKDSMMAMAAAQDALRAKFVPAFAETQRFRGAMSELDFAYRTGSVNAIEYANSVRVLKDEHAAAMVSMNIAAKSAADSMSVFSAQMDKLRAEFVPGVSEQQRYAQATDRLSQALRMGAITTEEHQQALRRLKQTYAESLNAMGASSKSVFGSIAADVKSASDSMGVFADEMDKLRSEFVPGFAAQQKYAQSVERLDRALRMGAVSSDEHRQAMRALQTEQRAASVVTTRLANDIVYQQNVSRSWNRGLSENRRAIQQLGFQVGDFATQIAGGQSAMLAFTQQGGQILQFFGPLGAVLAANLAVFGAFTIALSKSGQSLTALAPALALTSDQVRAIADAWNWLGRTLLTVANFMINHLAAFMAMGAAVAAFFATRWVASMVASAFATNTLRAMLLSVAIAYHTAGAGAAAATVATNLFSAALVTLRTVMIRLGIPALIIGLGFLVEAMMRVAKGAGGLANGFRLMGDVAAAVWEYIVVSASSIPTRLQQLWNLVLIGFHSMIESMAGAWYSFLASMGVAAKKIGLDAVAEGFGSAAEVAGGYLSDALDAKDRLTSANAALSKKIATDSTNAAGKVKTAWEAVKNAWREGSSAIDLGTMFGGKGKGGGGGAGDKAKEEAEEIKKIFDDMKNSIADSIMSSFKSLLKGTTSVKDALLSILGNILDKVMDIVAQPIFNAVSGSITKGIFGMLKLPSFEGGGNTWSGPRSGGIDGRGGRLAVLHSDETVTDHRNGSGSGGVNVYMTVNTPNAESFRSSRRQIMQEVRAAAR